MANTIQVNVVADTRGLTKGIKSTQSSLSRMGKSVVSTGSVLKGALIGGAVFKGLDLLTSKFTDAAAAVQEQDQLSAQTQAALKSTGAAAGVTASQVQALGDSIERKSMLDSEAIRSGENLLLTFTNIRNAAGKGNDIFNQTTQVMADMSTALGQDTKSSAIQLGKALNDPVKGVTALQRVGVSFTESQKKQIKTLVDSGQTMKAQKLILGELNKEFGGSAKAAGQTAAGQFKHFKDMVDDAFEAIVRKAIPILLKLATYLTNNLPSALAAAQPYIDKFKSVFAAIEPVLGAVFDFMKNNKGVVIAFAATIGIVTAAVAVLNAVLAINPITLIVIALAALVAGLVYAYNHFTTFRNIVDKTWSFIKSATQAVWPIFKTIVTTYINTVNTAKGGGR